MKLKKPRKMLPGETVMEGDEYKPNGDGWCTHRPLPKKKKVKDVYTFGKWYNHYEIYRNGVYIAYSYVKAYAKLICDALNEMEERK